ncbi:MAG TPA: methyltransferase domain-containing protein [Solirubrobacterales bacterium]|nr:methyltransferase domain-containing protein [Solirubrobacterales bacterium]
MVLIAAPETGGDNAERTYEAMASVYDDFTAHHEYDLWTVDLLKVLDRHGLRGKRLLDVACGTGKSFLEMLPRGWQVTGCDISPAMLEQARKKAGDEVALTVADMTKLPGFGEFDLVWALDDAINYLLNSDELERALVGMRANLAPTGLLLFDVNALQAYRTFFAQTEVVERGGRRLVWHGLTAPNAPPRSICESRLEIDSGESLVHRQRHFPEADVLNALKKAGLECLDVYGMNFDGLFRQPLDEETHTKAIYIARKSD